MSEDIPKQRTEQQNKSLWLFYTLLADALNEAGLDMRVVLKPTYNLSWNQNMVHDHLWLPIQKALYKTESTTFLHKQGQIDKIHSIIMRELGEKFGVEYIPFPHNEEKTRELLKPTIRQNYNELNL